jgi:HK97 family phage prohead protease
MNEIEIRVSQVADVSFPKRLIDLIVVPYEIETEVAHRGKMISEVVSRGAFDGIEQRPNRIKVNRDHDVRRTIGKAVAFYPTRSEGLIAQIKITPRVPLGDETLELAADGVLDASAGFRVNNKPHAEVWETRTKRRLNSLWLAHIALTPEPAYETANVLAVRTVRDPEPVAVGATPNRDRVQIDEWRRQAAVLDARYNV